MVQGAAVAQVSSLAQELPHAVGMAKKKKKKTYSFSIALSCHLFHNFLGIYVSSKCSISLASLELIILVAVLFCYHVLAICLHIC